jgi:hypothetical protein
MSRSVGAWTNVSFKFVVPPSSIEGGKASSVAVTVPASARGTVRARAKIAAIASLCLDLPRIVPVRLHMPRFPANGLHSAAQAGGLSSRCGRTILENAAENILVADL